MSLLIACCLALVVMAVSAILLVARKADDHDDFIRSRSNR